MLTTRTFKQGINRRLAGSPKNILDIGCGEGEYAIELAQDGHSVTGLTVDAGESRAARRTARGLGLVGCTFIHADARELRRALPGRSFDAVLMMNMLHLMAKTESRGVIAAAKDLTRSLGVNAVSAYVVDGLGISGLNKQRMMAPGELLACYDSDGAWIVEEYHEDASAYRNIAGKQYVDSHANLIARKMPVKPQSAYVAARG